MSPLIVVRLDLDQRAAGGASDAAELDLGGRVAAEGLRVDEEATSPCLTPMRTSPDADLRSTRALGDRRRSAGRRTPCSTPRASPPRRSATSPDAELIVPPPLAEPTWTSPEAVFTSESAADRAELDVAARRADLGVALDVLDLDVPGCGVHLDRAEPAGCAERRPRRVRIDVRSFRRADADVVLVAPEARTACVRSITMSRPCCSTFRSSTLPRIASTSTVVSGDIGGLDLDPAGADAEAQLRRLRGGEVVPHRDPPPPPRGATDAGGPEVDAIVTAIRRLPFRQMSEQSGYVPHASSFQLWP